MHDNDVWQMRNEVPGQLVGVGMCAVLVSLRPHSTHRTNPRGFPPRIGTFGAPSTLCRLLIFFFMANFFFFFFFDTSDLVIDTF